MKIVEQQIIIIKEECNDDDFDKKYLNTVLGIVVVLIVFLVLFGIYINVC